MTLPDRKLLYDILWNVAAPLTVGALLYFIHIWQPVKNHLADGLWAYALASMILIIWNRQVNMVWLMAIVLCFALFEALQYTGSIAGTGDPLDAVVYILFLIIALTVNPLFKHKQPQT